MVNWRFIGLLSLVQGISVCFLPAKGNQARSGDNEVYHERQHWRHCLLPALNGLLQREEAITRRELNEIADRVHLEAHRLEHANLWLRPYAMIQARIQKRRRHLFGDYDVNVLIAALDARNKVVAWTKQGTNDDEPDGDNALPSIASYGDELVGIILKKTQQWVAMRMIKGHWYKFESHRRVPLRLSEEVRVKAEMASALANAGRVLIVVKKDSVGD